MFSKTAEQHGEQRSRGEEGPRVGLVNVHRQVVHDPIDRLRLAGDAEGAQEGAKYHVERHVDEAEGADEVIAERGEVRVAVLAVG